jgi:hypothetical protein
MGEAVHFAEIANGDSRERHGAKGEERRAKG